MEKYTFNEVINSKEGSKFRVTLPIEGEYIVRVKLNLCGHRYLVDNAINEVFLITDAVVNAQFERVSKPLSFMEAVKIVGESGGDAYVKVCHSYVEDIEEFDRFEDLSVLLDQLQKGFTSSGIATIIENGDWYVEPLFEPED